MLEPFLLFVAGLAGTLLLTPYVVRLSSRWGAMDEPGSGKFTSTPCRGSAGWPFLVPSLLHPSWLCWPVSAFEPALRKRPVLAVAGGGATLVFLLGIYDDIWNASIWMKFSVQFAAALLPMAWGGIRIEHLGIPFDGVVSLGWLSWPLTALWIVGVTNAFNLIDGLDGLAGASRSSPSPPSSPSASWWGAVARGARFGGPFGGRCSGFALQPLSRQDLFGRLREHVLGFMLAVLSVVGVSKKTTTLALLIPILVVGVPVFDTLLPWGAAWRTRWLWRGSGGLLPSVPCLARTSRTSTMSSWAWATRTGRRSSSCTGCPSLWLSLP